ncbi:exodeoxyribonuclease VII small subunit [bacterium]|nr:exodeoxyribonuclease VII small subunit [bacterium]
MDIKNLTYTEAINSLEEIVAKMQSPECDIDRLAEYTSRALELMQHCKAKLTKTEEDVHKALEAISASNA